MAQILVVDDSPDVLLLCKVHLEYEGHTVATASGGEEAFARIRAARPDLVLLDIMMPDVDGWDVLAGIRKQEETKSIPVVMLTARGDGLDEIRGWREGAAGYVTKPFNPAALSQTVHRALLRSPSETMAVREEMLGRLAFDLRVEAGSSQNEQDA